MASNEYRSEFFEIDVSCEACHGPGSVHVELAEGRSLFWDRRLGYGLTNTLKGASHTRQIETCAPCHSRRAAIHPGYYAGETFMSHYEPQLLHEGIYHADGQILDEVYVYGSFLQSKMYHQGVRCTDCHDPHSLKLKFEGNRLCAQCHQPGKYDSPSHHHHVDEAATQCVSCHMPSRVYMGIDDRRDHSLRVPRPDLSVAIGTPNACNDCHDKPEEDAAWAAEAVREWYGEKRADDPHWGPAIAAAQRSEPSGEEMLREVLGRRELPDIVRATAIELLANYATETSERERRAALKHDNPMVRAAAVRSLPQPTLAAQPNAGDRDNRLAEVVRESQSKFVRSLEPLLRDSILSVRLAAASRLVSVAGALADADYRDALLRAVDEYRAAQRIMLDRVESHLNLAILSANLGEPQDAIESLRTAIRIAPYRTDPRELLAQILTATGGDPQEIRRLREEEIENLRRDSRLLRGVAGPHYRCGLLLYLLGREDEAREELKQACMLGPHEYHHWLAFSQLCVKQRRWDEAELALTRMEQLQPGSPDVRNI
ncbi:MAG: cytochrome c3 family protein, partial [Planctomycetota bacterium]